MSHSDVFALHLKMRVFDNKFDSIPLNPNTKLLVSMLYIVRECVVFSKNCQDFDKLASLFH